MDKSISNAKSALIACEVFRAEIERILPMNPNILKVDWLQMDWHDRPLDLRAMLQQKINELERDPLIDAILIAYGVCGNATLNLKSSRVSLVYFKSHDCIGILLGGGEACAKIHEANPRAYWFSPGWIAGGRVPSPEYLQKMKENFEKTHDPDVIDDLMEVTMDQYKPYQQAIYLDTQHTTRSEDLKVVEATAKLHQWTTGSLPANLELLNRLLAGRWDHEDIVVQTPIS